MQRAEQRRHLDGRSDIDDRNTAQRTEFGQGPLQGRDRLLPQVDVGL
jgi:hypothetical protein